MLLTREMLLPKRNHFSNPSLLHFEMRWLSQLLFFFNYNLLFLLRLKENSNPGHAEQNKYLNSEAGNIIYEGI